MRDRGHVFEESETAITPEKILVLCDALSAVWQAATEATAQAVKSMSGRYMRDDAGTLYVAFDDVLAAVRSMAPQ